ncbi:CDC48 family AAA ATPase [Methanolobus halotolerans]|uniref:ATPase n=1 Tax=Methanolobus halotolerans TaxID=2052935 RepID=A0A4E0QAZ3_9EURY|nr:CDC48 family AAA ATPase [Methanolobus halotolerans]TGC09714.1 ATPase [Methanolobus halotolerans]
MTEEITVSVGQAYPRDVGRGIARLDKDLMQSIGVISGDIVEIGNKEKCYAIVWPGYLDDAGKDIIRIDGNLRNNAKVGIDDRATVRKVAATEAERIVLAPTRETRLVGGARFILRILEGRPITKGQSIRVEAVNNPISFVVLSTKPSGPVIVSRNTQIQLRESTVVQESVAGQITYEDIGGLKRELGLVREMIELPLKHPELFEKLSIDPPKGVLLFGPPGTGKTLIARAVASETDANFTSVSGPEIVSKYYGESEQKLREIFEDAEKNAPSIVFIDEIDSIAPKRDEVVGEMERRVVAQLLSLMDGLASRGKVIVIGATNRPNSIDEALRRGGRFDREIEVGIPDAEGRLQILFVHTRGMPLEQGLALEEIAGVTHGFVGADVSSLCKEAAMHALRRLLPELKIDDVEDEIPPEFMEKLIVTRKDFDDALKNIEPSAMREVFVEVPSVKWDDIGGLENAKQELAEAVEWPLKFPELFDAVGTRPPRGIMLFGPPGTGKTMLAKAVATESEANFISIKGPELLSKYIGESERAVRETFRKAKQAAPTVIFFDEIDAMASERGSSTDAHASERVVSQILTEIDGVEELKDVVIVAATNRPDIVDPALLRPGRFDRLIYVRPPDKKGREKIFRIHLSNKPLADDVNVRELSEMTDSYVGSDIEAICREASMLALREVVTPGVSREEIKTRIKGIKVTSEHFRKATKRVKPTTSRSAMSFYEQASGSFARYAANEEEKVMDVDEGTGYQ